MTIQVTDMGTFQLTANNAAVLSRRADTRAYRYIELYGIYTGGTFNILQ